MSMQIQVDPAGLTQEQREAVAVFILAYPAKGGGVPQSMAADVVEREPDGIQCDSVGLDPEIAQLAKEGGEFDASVAFGSAAPQTAVVELDKQGLPWDGRIHAESKAKIADGTWRKKRGVAMAQVVVAETELRQVMGAPPAPPVAHAMPGGVSIAKSPTWVMPGGISIAKSPTWVMPAPGDARQQFVGLVGRASAAIQVGKVTQAEVTQCCAAAGVPALPLLANRLDLVAQVAAQVDALIASRQ